MLEYHMDPSKVQDLGELIFEVRQVRLEGQIDLTEAEDIVIQDEWLLVIAKSASCLYHNLYLSHHFHFKS
jgi:23S rRNA-/tRNA-specific pseudouridylate synthase